MARSNVPVFGAGIAAVGIGLTLTSLGFGADVSAVFTRRAVDVWDYFLVAGAVLLFLGGPIYVVSSARRYLHGST